MKKLAIALFIFALNGKAQINNLNYKKHIVVLYKALHTPPDNADAGTAIDPGVLRNSFKYQDSLIKVGQIIKAGGFGGEGFKKYTGMDILKESDLLKAKNIIMKDPGYGKNFEAEFFIWLLPPQFEK